MPIVTSLFFVFFSSRFRVFFEIDSRMTGTTIFKIVVDIVAIEGIVAIVLYRVLLSLAPDVPRAHTGQSWALLFMLATF